MSHVLTGRVENSVDPDQMISSEVSSAGQVLIVHTQKKIRPVMFCFNSERMVMVACTLKSFAKQLNVVVSKIDQI